MSNKTINVNQLESELTKVLKDYVVDIEDLVQETTDKLTKEAKAAVKQVSPKNTGEYQKSWAVKTIKNAKTYTKKIWNAKKYRITHLLEFGHKVKRNGQVIGKVRPYPHIRKVEKTYVEKFISEIEKGAKK